MPSTYAALHYHIIFSTKDREPVIAPEWRSRLHEYLGGTVRGQDGIAICIGGVADHVHLLIGLKPTHCLADFMQTVKRDATAWVRTTLHQRLFAWQEGYAAITVSPSSLEDVRRYVLNQEEHHRVKTFREELIRVLKGAGISYGERYLD